MNAYLVGRPPLQSPFQISKKKSPGRTWVILGNIASLSRAYIRPVFATHLESCGATRDLAYEHANLGLEEALSPEPEPSEQAGSHVMMMAAGS